MARPLAALPAVARQAVLAAVVVGAAVAAAAARRHSPPVPCRKLRMVIPTLAAFGTSRTLRRRESKGLTRQPAVVVAAAEVVAVALAAAELLAEAPPMEALLWQQSLLAVVDLLAVERRVAVVLPAAGERAAAEAVGFLIRQTAKSLTRPRQEQSNRTSL
jgi:hypothetical protein